MVWLVLPVFLASIAGLVYSASTDGAQLEKAWNTDVEIAAVVAARLAEPAPDVVDSEEGDPEDEIDDDTELTDEERKEQRIDAAVEIKRDRAERVAEEESVLSQGSYIDSIRYRISQLPKLLGQSSLFVILMFLPMCLVGYWFIATGILKNHRQHRVLFRNMALIGTSSGFMLSVGGLMIMQHPAGDVDISVTLVAVGGVLFHLSQYLMSAGYFGIIVLLAGSRFARKALRQLAQFGRMALTNYIMQSVVMAAIFYSIGAGLYGEVSRAMQILLVIPIVLLQILYSRWWLSRFRFGPLEWVWRSATYKSLQKMKI